MTSPIKTGVLVPLKDLLGIFDKSSIADFWKRIFPNRAAQDARLAQCGFYLFRSDQAAPKEVQDLLSAPLHKELVAFSVTPHVNGQLISPFVAFPLNGESGASIGIIGQDSALGSISNKTESRVSPAEARVRLQVLFANWFFAVEAKDCTNDLCDLFTTRQGGDVKVNLEPVPLPATVFMLVVGLGAIAAMRRRRKPEPRRYQFRTGGFDPPVFCCEKQIVHLMHLAQPCLLDRFIKRPASWQAFY